MRSPGPVPLPARGARVAALTATVLLGALVGALVGAAARPAEAGWWDDLDKGEAVRLGDVFAEPSRHSDRILSFFAVLLGKDEVYFPIGTPFSEARWDNVAFWDDGAPIWEEETFKRKARPYFYVDRKHPQRDALLALPTYTRLEVTARIRAVHRGIPFLELLAWRPSGWRLGEEVVREVIRGDNRVRDGGNENLELAVQNYERALRPDLPPIYAMQVRQRAADVLRRLGRTVEADAMEGGAILGGAGAPESREPPVPGAPVAEPAAPLPPGSFLTPPSDLPGAPAEGAPPPAAPADVPPPVSTDLPGVEVPGAPAGPAAPDAAGSVPAPFPPPSDPGAPPAPPAGPAGTTRDLPLPPAEPGPPPASAAPPAPAALAPAVPAPKAPPRRQPRLEGVK